MTVESSAQGAAGEMQPAELLSWSMQDAWLGLGLVIFLLFATALAAVVVRRSDGIMALVRRYSLAVESSGPTAVELAYLIPVLVILSWRRADWSSLGFRKFNASTLGLGCGLTAVTYMVLMVYGLVLVLLKIRTQGDTLLEIMRTTRSPVGYVFAAVVAAPFAEEVFFRGFLFQGLRQRYGGTRAALLSSAVFAGLHLQLVALIPAFLLGYVLAFIYNRSNSIWPGMILHFLVNSFAMGLLLAMLRT